jgi:hypothetical protein
MRPADLLACQRDLYVRMSGMPVFRDVLRESLASPYKASHTEMPPFFQGFNAVDRMMGWAQNAMAIEVTPHMTDLVTWVAAEMHGTDEMVIDTQPGPYGLAHFEKPLVVRDVRGENLHLSWMLWGPVPMYARSIGDAKGVGVLGYTDTYHPDSQTDNYLQQVRRQMPEDVEAMGRWIYTSFTAMLDGDQVGPTFNEPRPDLPNQDPEWQGDLTGSTNVNRLVQALWTIMAEPLTDVREETVDRATKRRMERMKIPPKVTVITLRRPANPHQQDEEGHVEWQHHWIVRGHPRWQPYGPGRSERRLIWINPHLRGNLDAPLKQSDKVYVVKR